MTPESDTTWVVRSLPVGGQLPRGAFGTTLRIRGRHAWPAPGDLFPRGRHSSRNALVALAVAMLAIGAGRLTAAHSIRLLSLLVLAVLLVPAAQLGPQRLLAVVIAVLPLPLFVQGLGTSLTPFLVAGVWIALLAGGGASVVAIRARRSGLAVYWALLFGVVLSTLVAFWRGSADGDQRAALATRLVGIGVFLLCLLTLRSTRDVERAYLALVVGGVLVLVLGAVHLMAPDVVIPGMAHAIGAIQEAGGAGSNLRIGGPVGDYELLAELCAVVGIIGVFFGLRTEGMARLLWLGAAAAAVIGIAATSTRSALLLFVAGALLASVLGARQLRRRWSALAAGCALALGVAAVLGALQSNYGSGHVLDRFSGMPTDRGLLALVDRASVWPTFWSNLPTGGDLVLGSGIAFDYATHHSWPHSLPLTLLFTVGVAGTVAFYALCLATLFRCGVAFRGTGSPHALVGAIVLAVLLLDETKVEFVRTYNYEWFVWGVLGVCAASAVVASSEGGRDHDHDHDHDRPSARAGALQ